MAVISDPLSGPAGRTDQRASLGGAIVFSAAALALTFVLALSRGRLGSPWSPGWSTIIALSAFAAHVVLVLRRANPADPIIWVPFAMLLFYFAMPVALALSGSSSGGDYDVWRVGAPRHLTQGFVAALLTLVALLAGIHAAGLENVNRGAARPARLGRSLMGASLLVATGGFLMLVVGIALVGPQLLFGSYADVWYARHAGLDVRLLQAGLIFAGGGVYGMLASHLPEQKLMTVYALGLAVLLVLFGAVSGDRAYMVSFGFSGAWVFSRSVRRLPWVAVIAAVVTGFFLLPIIKEYREYRALEIARRAPLQDLAASTMVEMGQTHLVFGHTLDLIPERKNYDYGMGYVYSLLNSIPNPGLTPGKQFLPDPLEHAPAAWLVSTIDPFRHALGGGFGFAIGAEWYFNFGIGGILLGMVAVGFGLAKVRNAAARSPAMMLVSAAVFQTLLFLVRNSSGAALKAGLWPIAGVMIAHWTLALVSSRGRRLTTPLSRRS